MTVQTILPANSVTGSYDVDNSLRFNFASSDYLNLTAAGNSTLSTKGTWSTWVKKSNPGSSRGSLFSGYADASNRVYLVINTDAIVVFGKVGGTVRYTAQVDQYNRDPSAWMNIVVAIDTTQGTDTNRIKIFINGTIATIGSTNTPVYPVQDSAIPYAATNSYTNLVGALYSTSLSQYLDGYLAETVFVDGLALDATSFGEFDDSGIWKPIDVSGLTFGNNGFYLEFKESGTSANSSGIGADTSGNDHHFTVNNLTAVDQTTDTCTNNFATVNSLDSFYEASTFSEGNLKIVTESGDYSYNTSTIGLSSGKWYCEVFVESSPTGSASIIGIAGRMSEASLGFLGGYVDTYGFYGANGNMYNIGGNGVTSYGSGYAANSVIGIYMDLDNNKLYFAINGSIQNSGTGYTILAPNLTKAGAYFPAAADNYNGSSGTFRLNFGNPIYALSSANTDVNGYGSFEFDPSSGTFDGASKDFLAICTKNLAEYG